MYVTKHGIIGAHCLDEASCPEVWRVQEDLVEVLRDHSALTSEQVREALSGVLHAFSLSWNEIRYTDRDQCEAGQTRSGSRIRLHI